MLIAYSTSKILRKTEKTISSGLCRTRTITAMLETDEPPIATRDAWSPKDNDFRDKPAASTNSDKPRHVSLRANEKIHSLPAHLVRRPSDVPKSDRVLRVNDDNFTLKYGDAIHHGQYTNVYKGHLNGQKVAIKEIDLTAIRDPSLYVRGISEFMQEGYILSELDHPNIVKLLCADLTSPTRRVLVLQWLEGHDFYVHLHTLCARFRTIRQILTLADVLTSTYEYMHSKDVVNRDIKSLNIMIDPSKENHLTIIDFGTSRKDDPKGTMTPRTGSYRWASPENLRGQQYGKPADVYSFGVVMWEAISGELPYEGFTPDQAGQMVALENARPGNFNVGPNCTQELCDLLMRTWDDDPLKRPTFTELNKEIREMLVQLPPIVEDNGLCGCKVS
mmetsp:Transcript_44829/g.73003  ORF Transcript_44829/g.73003 Transcript_44829/m.73003 type:complete len:390 (-) Transcript_44829:453-1622(-)